MLSSEREVSAELTRDLFARSRVSIAFILPVLFALRQFASRAFADSALSRALLITCFVAVIARGAVSWLLRVRDVRVQKTALLIPTALLGANLGGLVFVLYPRLDALGIALVAVCVAGLNSVAAVSMAPSRAAYFSYLLPSLGALLLRAVLTPRPELGPWFAPLVLLYIAALSALALHVHASRRRLVELQLRFRQLAQRDSLTRLRNRRFVAEYMDRQTGGFAAEWRENAERTRTLGAMVVDVDHFKRVNDRRGHDAGDALLRQVAHVLETSVRASDVVVRWGGDEFVVLAPDADRDTLQGIAERIRERTESRVFPLPSGPTCRITCSIGYTVCELALDGPGILKWEELVAIADHALGQAKGAGRNRTAGLFPSRRFRGPAAQILKALQGAGGVEASVGAGVVELRVTAGEEGSEDGSAATAVA